MKRVIVEGMDGTGKSTLVTHLWTEFTHLTPVVNKLGPDQDLFNWWLKHLVPNSLGLTPVYDRFFYSELVYGPIIRGHLKVTHEQVLFMYNQLREKALLIFARPSIEDILSVINNKEQMKGVEDHLHDLVLKYDEVMMQEADHYGRRFYVYDWRHENEPGRVTKFVRDYLSGALT